MIAGIVVAGGTARRFDPTVADKALLEIGGVAMIRRVVDGLTVADRVVINARDSQRESLAAVLADCDRPVAFAVDPTPQRGPVAGLATALEATTADRVLALGCDRPLVEPAALQALADRCEPRPDAAEGPPDACLPVVEGRRQPLCGAYRRDPLAAAIDALADTSHRSFGAVLDHLAVATVPADELPGGPEAFLDVNTPADLERARRLLATDRSEPSDG